CIIIGGPITAGKIRLKTDDRRGKRSRLDPCPEIICVLKKKSDSWTEQEGKDLGAETGPRQEALHLGEQRLVCTNSSRVTHIQPERNFGDLLKAQHRNHADTERQ
ncbi:hypothetical protein BV898_19961, partial [Hypsibius exemplaris]